MTQSKVMYVIAGKPDTKLRFYSLLNGWEDDIASGTRLFDTEDQARNSSYFDIARKQLPAGSKIYVRRVKVTLL